MRIHADHLNSGNLYTAARAARVDMELTFHKSRSRGAAFNVTLSGESNRRPNRDHASDEFAATWDQWGVFLGHLFNIDENMFVLGYDGAEDFHYKTHNRFTDPGKFPHDSHGDHTFRFDGVPHQNKCTKCTATRRWK